MYRSIIYSSPQTRLAGICKINSSFYTSMIFPARNLRDLFGDFLNWRATKKAHCNHPDSKTSSQAMKAMTQGTDGFNDGPSDFDGEAASMGGQHIHAEHDPHTRGQGRRADHSAPDQSQLADVVNGQPIGEGLDQVHLANQKGHSGIGFGTPIVLPERCWEKKGHVRKHLNI